MALALINLVKSNSDRVLVREYCARAIDLDFHDSDGRTAFWYAHRNHDTHTMRILIEEGANNLFVRPFGRYEDGTFYPDRIVRWYELVDGSEYDTFFKTHVDYGRLIMRAGVDIEADKIVEIYGEEGKSYVRRYSFQ